MVSGMAKERTKGEGRMKKRNFRRHLAAAADEVFRFHISFATSQGGVKGRARGLSVRVAAAAPFGAVFDDPIGQGALKADVAAGFFGFNPLVAEDFLALGLKFAVEGGVFHQVIARNVFVFVGHTR
jgi:hypothetical protein